MTRCPGGGDVLQQVLRTTANSAADWKRQSARRKVQGKEISAAEARQPGFQALWDGRLQRAELGPLRAAPPVPGKRCTHQASGSGNLSSRDSRLQLGSG